MDIKDFSAEQKAIYFATLATMYLELSPAARLEFCECLDELIATWSKSQKTGSG